MKTVKIGSRLVGDGQPCFIVAEIGINHNGEVELARQLIDTAAAAGCDAVKFQKRTPEICVPRDQWEIVRETPWGLLTYIDYKHRIEFGEREYAEIDAHCRAREIPWFASCWDLPSVDFINRFDPPAYKIASASLTDDELLMHTRERHRPVILSTGMSTLEQVDHAVEVLGRDELCVLHACSTYPANFDELNLRVIPEFRKRYDVPIGYSGHETGLPSTVAAVALGASVIERHITMDRAMWGTDQAASLAPNGIQRLVRDIRLIEMAMGSPHKQLIERERAVMHKLRRVG